MAEHGLIQRTPACPAHSTSDVRRQCGTRSAGAPLPRPASVPWTAGPAMRHSVGRGAATATAPGLRPPALGASRCDGGSVGGSVGGGGVRIHQPPSQKHSPQGKRCQGPVGRPAPTCIPGEQAGAAPRRPLAPRQDTCYCRCFSTTGLAIRASLSSFSSSLGCACGDCALRGGGATLLCKSHFYAYTAVQQASEAELGRQLGAYTIYTSHAQRGRVQAGS